MGDSWTAVRDGTRNRTLRREDASAAAVALRWDELIRYIALDLTKNLGTQVRQQLAPGERTPEQRQRSLVESLAVDGTMTASLSVPHAAGALNLVADLRAREISAVTQLDAPQEGRSRGRVSWLLKQLVSAPDVLKLESRAAYATQTRAATLSEVRANPECLFPEGDKDIKEFTLSLSRVPGLNRDSGRGSFSDSVLDLAREFYGQVLQPLRPWKEAAPKLTAREAPAQEIKERVVEILPAIADAVEVAQQEAGKAQRAADGTT
jgi:hypothetical protein